jgi:hypothetical protein
VVVKKLSEAWFGVEIGANRASRSRPSFFVRDRCSCCFTHGPINLNDGLDLIISYCFEYEGFWLAASMRSFSSSC